MFCNHCGNPNTSDARVCSACGSSLQLPQSPGQQPYAQQQAGNGNNAPIEVPNYMVFSILVTLFCCLPLGIAAIIFSSQVNTKLAVGDIQGAMNASKTARMLCIISVVIGIVMVFSSVMQFILNGH